MDLFDFNHDGEVSDLERIIGLAAVLSETNPDVEISVNEKTHDLHLPSAYPLPVAVVRLRNHDKCVGKRFGP